MTTEPAPEEAPETAPEQPPTKEVRYALVLNGGVSLAVWMGGVTHELNRLRLASRDAGHSPAWRAILDAAKRTATVDLVAGTSAGGLNGAVLATAVARGGDMPNMRERWATMASLEVGELTHRDPESALSLLNGDVLEARIDEVLGEIGQRDDRAKECTLFTTATALDSRIVTNLENGTPVRTADGRRVYRFDRRNAVEGADAVDDFAPEMSRTLVTAARATAAFPVAFDPVAETDELRARHDRSVTDIAALDAAPVRLVDGGVLDNAPFEPLLRALRERPTTEPYERVLLYVTPSVEAELAPSESPKLLETLTSVLAATREPDERLDVDALKQTFELMGVTSAQPHSVITAYLAKSPNGVAVQDLSTAGNSLLDLYRHGRTESLQRKLERCCTLRSPLQPPGDVHLSPADVPGGTPVSLVVNGEWRWGAPTADHLLRWWGRALSNLHGKERIGRSRFDCVEALAVVGASQREVTAIRAELIAAIEDVDPGKDRAGTIDDPRLGELQTLYEEHGDALRKAVTDAAKAVANATDRDMKEVLEFALSVEVVAFALNWGGAENDPPRFRYQNLTPAIAAPTHLQLGVPDDWAQQKLYGLRWRHFGAFAIRAGREHDWLWGRIDGATTLARGLLAHVETGGKPIPKATIDALTSNLVDEILSEEDAPLEKLEEGVTKVTGLTDKRLLGEMLRDIDGKATFDKLRKTAWVLSDQVGIAGNFARAAFGDRVPKAGRGWRFQFALWGVRAAAFPVRMFANTALFLTMTMARRTACAEGSSSRDQL